MDTVTRKSFLRTLAAASAFAGMHPLPAFAKAWNDTTSWGPSACEGERGIAAMKTIVRLFHRHGGSVVQFTVFSAEELRDTQAHPEKYENLQVCVCGWNVRWNDLTKREQDAYILRAERIMR